MTAMPRSMVRAVVPKDAGRGIESGIRSDDPGVAVRHSPPLENRKQSLPQGMDGGGGGGGGAETGGAGAGTSTPTGGGITTSGPGSVAVKFPSPCHGMPVILLGPGEVGAELPAIVVS